MYNRRKNYAHVIAHNSRYLLKKWYKENNVEVGRVVAREAGNFIAGFCTFAAIVLLPIVVALI